MEEAQRYTTQATITSRLQQLEKAQEMTLKCSLRSVGLVQDRSLIGLTIIWVYWYRFG
jgi:hypothetical protein